jgi:hypothetical protein
LNIALENHHFQWGSNIWPFSIAVVNYQRVNPPFLNLASRSSTAHWGKVTNAPLKKVGVPQKMLARLHDMGMTWVYIYMGMTYA